MPAPQNLSEVSSSPFWSNNFNDLVNFTSYAFVRGLSNFIKIVLLALTVAKSRAVLAVWLSNICIRFAYDGSRVGHWWCSVKLIQTMWIVGCLSDSSLVDLLPVWSLRIRINDWEIRKSYKRPFATFVLFREKRDSKRMNVLQSTMYVNSIAFLKIT